MPHPNQDTAGSSPSRRLHVYNGGFLTQGTVRRILTLAGYDIRIGLPDDDGLVGVWGMSPKSHRGEAVADRRGAGIVRVEDAWLRSLFPGRIGNEPPLGLLIDHGGVHFDPAQPSDLERLLKTHDLDDSHLLGRARDVIARLKAGHLSKYAAVDPAAPSPQPGYVLVIDQTRGDASVRASGADLAEFKEMLFFAREENPGARILIKSHPETAGGARAGYFGPSDIGPGVEIYSGEASPWSLLEGAVAVYTVSSQLGFEAILAGHKPRVFGRPFYAGWGLTQDERPLDRRQRALTRAQLVAAAMILYPRWYDPCHDRLCEIEEVLDTLEAQVRAWREDRHGWVAGEMRLWKRKPLQQFYGRYRRIRFARSPQEAGAEGRRTMVWASKAEAWPDAVWVEDGFLRSRGLGAELVPPLSLVTDDLGIYYDPSRESRLERLIAEAPALRPDQLRRAEALRRQLLEAGLSKYNLGGEVPDLPAGHRVLVPGQVEDDASILRGTGEVRTDLALLRAARRAHPEAVLIYKPHPDVLAGLRSGAVDDESLAGLADVVLGPSDPAALLARVDEVWTMTSALGFEALLREVPVTCLGAPFYAGWGLTRDLGPVPDRRRARVTLAGLVHAALIDYPRYRDPVTGLPCPPEVVVDRLAAGRVAHPGLGNRLLAKLQGVFASQSWIWR